MYETVVANLSSIQEEIEPCKPRIIAVTKYFDENAMVAAYNAGLRDFGESRVIEACSKIERLPKEVRDNSTFHFIGHLQTNKVKKTVEMFDYIHSVDSVKLAQCISDCATSIGKVQKILLQINNANEEQKFGFSVSEIFQVIEQLKSISGIEIVGLMSMTPLGASDEEIRKLYTEVLKIKNKLDVEYNCNMKELSMGMSQDYKIAAQVGSTMLRIGRKLFS